uniref:Uncharacterized protein n=1 Tax=Panstrongylus lignarius TaxID=156445 RepID=A0A224Y6B7_9HEMI
MVYCILRVFLLFLHILYSKNYRYEGKACLLLLLEFQLLMVYCILCVFLLFLHILYSMNYRYNYYFAKNLL